MSKSFHHLKGRIKNILRYKNPGLWVIAVSIIIVAAVGIGLAADPKANVLNEPGKSVITDKIDEASESDGSNGSEQTAGSAQLSNSATSTHITVKPEAPEASQVQEPCAGKPEIDYTSDENVTSDGIDKIKLDGYLAEVTGIQDSYVDEIYVWGYVAHHGGFGNQVYLPLLETRNNNVIGDILNTINDKSLWQEKFQDIGSVHGQDYDINSVHVDFRMKSVGGSAFISLHINPVSREISAECVWHPKGGKHITFLYSANGELYAIMMRKLFNINIENGWRVSGDMNNKDFMCYSLKDKYSTDETLTINAVLINNGDENIALEGSTKAWIKLTGEQDFKLWEDIDIAMSANSVLRPGDRLYLNLVQIDFERAGLKPGTYTVEGEIGEYTVDGIRIVISAE